MPSNPLVEEHDRVDRLILGGGCHLALHRKMSQERFHFSAAHLSGMPPAVRGAMEQDESPGPVPVRFLRAQRIMLAAYDGHHLVEKIHDDRQNSRIPNKPQTYIGGRQFGSDCTYPAVRTILRSD